ncbi:hypothetical protein QR680_004836 [Steinernema hermaphroditum]|uniref:Anti-proliferative protein domain-containing protein n=1 Tax=Steinernema hermaphroditum TaxID=289476 RepID=A0AA39LUM6_9BILA|nr:hypothetical protein QR680_004829 [Steinernema hermaphroditum]KAK0409921.1 hypothetical protein QR680_004836 [Steinernema hermaphroditum]
MYNEIKEIVNFVIRRMNGSGPLIVPARQVYHFATELANALRERFMINWTDPAMNGKRLLKMGATLQDADEIFQKLFEHIFFHKDDYQHYAKGIAGSMTLFANPGEVYVVFNRKRESIYKGDPKINYCYLPQYLLNLKLESPSLVINHMFSGHRYNDTQAFIPLLLTTEDGSYCQPDAISHNDFTVRMLGAPSYTRRYTVAGFEMTKFGSHRSHKGAAACENQR